MNLKTINKELLYYSENKRKGTSDYYIQKPLNFGSLTFSVLIFKDRVYKERKACHDFRGRSSKIPKILFDIYKFPVLKNIE